MESHRSSRSEPEVIDLTAPTSPPIPNSLKRKHNQVGPHDVIDVDGDEDPSGVVVICNEDVVSGKSKIATTITKKWQMQIKNALAKDLTATQLTPSLPTSFWNSSASSWDSSTGAWDSSTSAWDSSTSATWNTSTYMSQNFDDYNQFSFDFNDSGGAVSLLPQFSTISPFPLVDSHIPSLQNDLFIDPNTTGSIASSKSSLCKQPKENGDEIMRRFGLFKQFDTVHDHSDHHYKSRPSSSGKSRGVSLTKAPMEWSKKIQQEWKLLRKDLPDSIFVRVYEDRMDLLRAVIVGAAGTPYHDGLFFFDIFFPSTYPNQPPLVYYHSGGLRLNPNLYNCGKVCLSLLNTWTGSKSEQWTPGKSTILQVLLSIQALVLNAKPYFNEPGYARMAGTPAGEKQSLAYNEQAFLLSCKTMLYTLQNPFKNFEDFVVGHFYERANSILEACKAYMEGAQVGCLVGGGVQDVDEGDKSCSLDFRQQLAQLLPRLLKALSDVGADCRKFEHLQHSAYSTGSMNLELKIGN